MDHISRYYFGDRSGQTGTSSDRNRNNSGLLTCDMVSLGELQSQNESATFDFKRFEALDDSKKFAKHLVGFANRQGGRIALGFDDSGGLQGDEIDYDQVMQTITNIAYTNCSPQIRFDDQYRRPPEGDFLILDIEPREEIPHAVVQRNESGEIEARDYWIRLQNTTRRVSDVELRRLFTTRLNPDFSREFRTWAVLSEVDNLTRVALPENNSLYPDLLRDLDIDIPENNNLFLSQIATELFPFAFLESLNLFHQQTWDVKRNASNDVFDSTSLLRAFPIKSIPQDLDIDTDTPSEKVEDSDIEILGYDRLRLSDFGELDEVLPNLEFHAPPNTKFRIAFSGSESDDDDEVDGLNFEISIQRNGEFVFTLADYRCRQGRGFPQGHPIKDVAIDNQFRRLPLFEINDEWVHCEIEVRFTADFMFPETTDSDIDLNDQYAERIWHVIEEYYSVDKFLASLPNTELYKVNHKLDMLVDALLD